MPAPMTRISTSFAFKRSLLQLDGRPILGLIGLVPRCMTLRRSQRLLRLHDVLAQQAHGFLDLAAAAELQQLVVLALRTILAGGTRHERAREAADMAVIRLDHRKQARAIAGRDRKSTRLNSSHV